MDLGSLEVCLKVKNVAMSAAFYERLGFQIKSLNTEQGFCELTRQDCRLALYGTEHIKENILNFRGGDVFSIAETLKSKGFEFETEAHVERDGSAGSRLRDPDGNLIYFNTSPAEAARRQGAST